MSVANLSRRQEMVRLHVEERKTFSEIGTIFGVSRERIRQIVRIMGVPQSLTREIQSAKNRLQKIPCPVCGTLFVPRLNSHGGRQHTCSNQCSGVLKRHYTHQQLIDHMKAVARKLGATPTIPDINAIAPPWHTHYYREFESFRAGQEAAGLVPNDTYFNSIPQLLPDDWNG